LKKLKQKQSLPSACILTNICYTAIGTKGDSLLVTKRTIYNRPAASVIKSLAKKELVYKQAHYFLPPYEWYNDSIATWTKQLGLQLVSFTPGTRSNADYTYPEMGNKYVDSKTIFQSILKYEQQSPNGLNGFYFIGPYWKQTQGAPISFICICQN